MSIQECVVNAVATASPVRKPVSPKLRFEVFKRDKFTCQYCGGRAPEVILNCDHIRPVVDGGLSDILNLITSCRECNGGKGARPLSESATLDKQRAMLEDLEERRQQIDFMIQWRDELQAHSADVVTIIDGKIAEKLGGWSLNEKGKSTLRKWLKHYTVADILTALDEATDLYVAYDPEDKILEESCEVVFRKIGNFLQMAKAEKTQPHIRRILYIQGILRKRTRGRCQRVDFLQHLVDCGASLDAIESHAKTVVDLVADFDQRWDAWLEKIGEPF